MADIQVLQRHVADLIAAGEVVERPASAVKELIENSIDAGATRITCEIQSGGLHYIRIADNGSGIPTEQAETAFLRHATSKLRTKEDLAAIGTLGFRGEALAAIAAVSRIDLLTKHKGHEGISLHLEAGKVMEKTAAGCPEGTTIIVRDLFYNTPARLKFMKNDRVESSHVAMAVQNQALANPQIAFKFIKDGEVQFQTDGRGNLYNAVYAILGRLLANDMVEVKSQWENMELTGFITKPTATRGNRANQMFFVNGRPVRSKILTAAFEEAYVNQLMAGRFPSCVLLLTLPASAVDVNVHPAKTEVKFAREKDVFDCVRFGVLGCLNKTPARPQMQIKPKTEGFQTMPAEAYQTLVRPSQTPVAPKVAQRFVAPKAASGAPAANSFGVRQAPALQTAPAPPAEEVFASSRKEAPKEPEAVAQQEALQTQLPLPKAAPYRLVGEVLHTYLIIEQGDEVLFLDKHAAHERIIFEQLKASTTDIMAQSLLTPITASLTPQEAACVLEHKDLLLRYGFEVDDFGRGCVILRQIPAGLDIGQAEDALAELAKRLLECRDTAAVRDDLLHTIACKAAIKAGWDTDRQELEALTRQVMERDDIKYCPHGRPVITTLTKKQLERQFKR